MKNFYHYLLKVVLTGLVLLNLPTLVMAQSISKNSPQDRKKELPKFNIFRPTASLRSGIETQKNVHFFELDKSLSRVLYQTAPANILFSIPIGQGNSLEIEMGRVELFSPNCKVLDANDNYIPLPSGKFYQSLSKDTTILFGFFENEVVGHLYFGDTQAHLSKITASTLRSTAEYALHAENENRENGGVCGTKGPMLSEDEIRKIQTETNTNIELRSSTGPILNMYYEVDYETYSRALSVKPSDQTVTSFITNWLSGVFFIKKVLYSKRTGINMRINTFKIWNTQDPYTGANSGKLLESFSNILYQKNFPGDFAQLIHARIYSDNVAGKAWLPREGGSLCKGNSRFSIVYEGRYMGIPPSKPYQFPDYDSPASTMAHELGHNLNADHSQSCSYTGRPLDNCSAPEDCGAGVTGPNPPTKGGHFMSYCHLKSSIGIDFATTDSRYTVIDQRIIQTWTSMPCAKDGVHQTTPDQISVTSPTANASYKSGGQITVRWSLSTLAEVQIVLRKASSGQTWMLAIQTYGFGSNEKTFVLPKTLPSGNDYSIRVGIVGSNLEMTAVYAESAKFTIEALPDLIIASGDLTVTGTTSSPTIRLENIKIQNQGYVSSVATRVGIYLSRDAQIGSGDQLLFNFDIEALTAGRITTKEFVYSPNVAFIANGTYYVGLIVDRSDLVKESDEQNNTFYWTSPRLTVNKGSSTSTLDVSPTVLNFIADGGTQTLSFTSNTAWSVSESLSWLNVSPVSGNNDGTPSVSCQANLSTAARTGTISIIGAGKVITVTVNQAGTTTIAPDLICTAGDLQINKNGNTYSLRISNLRISNQGNATAPSSRAGIYLSSDQTFSTADQLLGSLDIQALTSGGFVLRRTDINVNTLTLSAGQYYIGVLVDNVQAITERNENNNVYYWQSPIVEVEGSPAPANCTCMIPPDAQLLLCEDFQTFQEGAIAAQSSPNWRLWDPGSGDGLVTSNTNGDKVLLVHTSNNVNTDVLLLLGNRQAGIYELTWNMYIPSENGAYFNMQYDQDRIAYAFEVYLENGKVSLKSNGNTYPSSAAYTPNTWVPIKLIIDLDNQTAQFYINNQRGASIPYTYNQIGGIDFYALQNINTHYWVDDICFYKLNRENIANEKPDLLLRTGSLSINYTGVIPEITFGNLQILNQGKGLSSTTKAEVYVSDNFYISSSDIWIGSVVIESIAPGGALSKTASFKAPESLSPGEYYIGVLIDPDNTLDEELETNNADYWTSPKLLISSKNSCSMPSSVKIKSLSSSSFHIVWDYNPAISSYRVQVSYDLGQTWVTLDRYGSGELIRNNIAFYGMDAGERIMFRVKSLCDISESDWSTTLDFTLPTSAPNDDPCSAAELDASGFYSLGDLSNSKLSNLPFQCGVASKDTWFKVTATAATMTIELLELNSIGGIDLVLEIYTGSCNALQFVDCDDDGGSGLFPKITVNNLTVGRTYYIRVWDLNSIGTSFWINTFQFGQGNLINDLAVNPSISGQAKPVKNDIGELKLVTADRQLNALTIVPNPNDGSFVLGYKSSTLGKIALTVKDPTGRIHYRKIENQETDSNQYELNLSNLPTGLYIISITNQQGVEVNSKLIITH